VLSVVSLAFSVQVGFLEATLGFITDDIGIRAAFAFTAAAFAVLLPPLYFAWRRVYRETAAAGTVIVPAAGG
jgi:hypothetical protein